jgi:hypothetical protein
VWANLEIFPINGLIVNDQRQYIQTNTKEVSLLLQLVLCGRGQLEGESRAFV